MYRRYTKEKEKEIKTYHHKKSAKRKEDSKEERVTKSYKTNRKQ